MWQHQPVCEAFVVCGLSSCQTLYIYPVYRPINIITRTERTQKTPFSPPWYFLHVSLHHTYVFQQCTSAVTIYTTDLQKGQSALNKAQLIPILSNSWDSRRHEFVTPPMLLVQLDEGEQVCSYSRDSRWHKARNDNYMTEY